MLEKFKRGEEPRVGPQNNRRNSEGPLGRTSLHKPDEINGIFERDFEGAKK